MDVEKQGKIALALLKYLARKKGVRLTPDIKRELGNVAKETGVSVDDLKAFGKIITQELLEETFGE